MTNKERVRKCQHELAMAYLAFLMREQAKTACSLCTHRI